MPNICRTTYLSVICLFFLLGKSAASVAITPVPISNYESVFELNAHDIINLDKTGLENELGRKLTFKEKMALKFVKHKLKKNADMDGKAALEEVKTDGLAIAGFVCGIVGLLVFGFILGTLGVVFSAIALKRIKKNPAAIKGRGLAIAGLVIGIIAVVGWLIFALFFLAA